MFKKSTESALAIDLAADAVRVLEMKFTKGAPSLSALASQAVTGGALETLPERQLAALREILAGQRLKSRRCLVAMPTNLVVTRAVAIDKSKPQPAAEQVRRALQNCLSFKPEEAIFDFWPVNETGTNSWTSEVLVVATQASVVQRYLTGLEKLHLMCTHLDVSPCALATLVARGANGSAMVGTVVLGENLGYFAVVEGSKVLFWRPFELPAAKLTSAAQGGLGRVGDEISKCVSHMVGSRQVDPLTELLIFGHGSEQQAFTDYLKNRFHLPVRAPSPFEVLPADAIPAGLKDSVEAAATHFAAAVGLSLQPAGGIDG